MRLLFALRFRDLNLLISDQVTNESQLLFHRSIAQRAAADRAVPALRQGPLHRRRRGDRPARLRPGRIHRPATASPRPVVRPERRSRPRPRLARPFNYIRNSVKVAIDAYDGTMTFYVADPTDPIVRAYAGRLPRPVRADVGDARRASRRTSASRRSCSTSRPGCSAATTSRTPQPFFRQRRRLDGPEGQTTRADPAVRGLLRDHADARRAEGRVPAPPADGPAEPAEHDRLGGRPDGPAATTARRASTASRPTRRSSGPARSRRGSTRTR